MTMKYAIDVHSAFGPNLGPLIDRHKPDHVILHTYHGFEAARHADTFRQQVPSVQAKGKTVGSYGWAFQAYSPEQTVNESVRLFREAAGHEVPIWWADCEEYPRDNSGFWDPGPDVDWLHRAGTVLDSLGIRKGLYTSPAYAQERWGDRAWELSSWELWLAHWDGNAQLTSSYLPLYGWSKLAAKQWIVRPPNDEELDRDVILEEFTIPTGVVQPPQPPVPDPGDKDATIEGLRIALDDIVRDRMPLAIEKIRNGRAMVAEGEWELEAAIAEAARIRKQFLG